MSLTLLDHAEKGLVIFCGAGVSMVAPTCLPSWWEMNEQVVLALAEQIEMFCGKEQAGELARQINARRNTRQFPPEFQAEIITKHFGDSYFKVLECLDGDTPNAVHMMIAALAKSGHVRAIVTSNFDRVLEAAFEQVEVPLDVHFKTEHFESLAATLTAGSTPKTRCQLIKLHGSVDDHLTLVDTLAQRMRGLSPAIGHCLRHLLQNHHWLFMGYSGGDLEGNAQYLSLRNAAKRAVGFSWLVRDAAKDEPIEAVVKLCDHYGNKSDTPRGELPAWFFDQFGPLLPDNLPVPAVLSEEMLSLRKQQASQSIVDHTRAWAKEIGAVRSAMALANMLKQSVSNPQAARDLLTQVLAHVEDDGRGYIAVANSLANLLINAGELDDAMALVLSATTQLGDDNEKDWAGFHSTMGLIEQAKGEYQKALEHFGQTYQYSTQLNDKNLQGIALHNRAMALSSMGELEPAKLCYEEELMIVKQLGDVVAQAQVLNNIGQLLQQQDKYDEAIDVLEQSIELRERLGDDKGIAHCMGNIAVVHFRRGDFDEASSSYEQILAIFQRIGNQPNEITTRYKLGDVARQQRNLQAAEQHYQQGKARAIDLGFESLKAEGLWKQAAIYRESEQIEEARQYYAEALAIYQQQGDSASEADVLNELGILLWQTDQLDPAVDIFEKAILIHERLNQPVSRASVIGNLALVLRQKGELDRALSLFQEKISIAEALGAKSEAANAHYNLAAILHEQGAIDKALVSFEVAQRLFQEMGITIRAIDILSTMGEICGFEGKISASFHWFDQAIPLATTDEARTMIARRLVPVLELLLQSGHPDLAERCIQRLRALGVEIDIKGPT